MRQRLLSQRRYLLQHESPRAAARVLGVLRTAAAARLLRDAILLRAARDPERRVRLRDSISMWRALLDERRATMLARVSGSSLTTAIVRDGVLCGYRCTELASDWPRLTPQALLDEIYPVAAYYQDTWREGIQAVRLAGLAERTEEFRRPLESELRCPVAGLLATASSEGRIPSPVRPLAERQLEALIGWSMNRGG